MSIGRYSIGALADAAGLTRRAIRFYIQRGLLQSPDGLGRGAEYDQTHLARLKQIADLQTAGHSLDAIEKIIAGAPAPEILPLPGQRIRPHMSATLWTRMAIAEGIELNIDVARQPSSEQLRAIRQAIRTLLKLEGNE